MRRLGSTTSDMFKNSKSATAVKIVAAGSESLTSLYTMNTGTVTAVGTPNDRNCWAARRRAMRTSCASSLARTAATRLATTASHA